VTISQAPLALLRNGARISRLSLDALAALLVVALAEAAIRVGRRSCSMIARPDRHR